MDGKQNRGTLNGFKHDKIEGIIRGTVAFRTDANSEIAFGHVMRCLSIADAAGSNGFRVVFICADDKCVTLINKRGYEVHILDTDWRNLDGEINALAACLKCWNVNWLFVDSYFVTENYLSKLKQLVYTIYIDDHINQFYDVNSLLCYAIYAEEMDDRIRIQYQENGTRLLLGTRYVPLRKQFQKHSCKKKKEMIERVLVLSGGNDLYKVKNMLLEVLLDYSDCWSVAVVCGDNTKQFEELLQKYGDCDRVKIYGMVDDMPRLMDRSDVCISAAGSTLYELCTCGVPTMSYTMADNQLRNAQKFDELGVIPYIGDVRDREYRQEVVEMLDRLIENEVVSSEFEIISGRMKSCVDGNGSERVIEELLMGGS